MPYLVQITDHALNPDKDDVDGREIYDDESKSVRQALDRIGATLGAEVADCEIRVWTVTGPARVYKAEPAIRFEGSS